MNKKIILFAEVILIIIVIFLFISSIKYFDEIGVEAIIILMTVYLLVVYKSLFIFYKQKPFRIRDKGDLSIIKTINDLKKHEMLTTSTINKKTYIQPMNIIIKTNKNIETIMKKDGWVECETYSKHYIKLVTLIKNALKKIPPITDAYFLRNPQYIGLQKDETYTSRNHIRIWKLGKKEKYLYIGAISLDDKLSIRKHNNLFVPSHSIDPDADVTREKFMQTLKKIYPKAKITKFKIGTPKKKGEARWYYTDGAISQIEI